MNRPLLSLCIPTYNRSTYLRKCVDSIVCQDEFLNGMVEVIISDNASDDDTNIVMKPYADKYRNFFYYRNQKNLCDENFPLALGRGNGVHRRLINDTLIFLPGSLKYICGVISKYKDNYPCVFWSNGKSRDGTEMTINDFRSFILNESYWITSIACFSIWECQCDNIEQDTAGCELKLWQVKKLLELAYESNKILVCNKVLTAAQEIEKKNVSYGLFKVFGENFFALLEPYFSNHSLNKEDKEFLEKNILFEFFLNWCIKWEINQGEQIYSETENLKKAIHDKYCNKEYWSEYCTLYRKKLLKVRLKKIVREIRRKK